MIPVQVRWLIRNDAQQYVAIEAASLENPWCEEDFLRCLRQRNCIGMVAEDCDGRIHGFVIYELHRGHLKILNLAVDPASRRQRVGTQIIKRLTEKLSRQRRKYLFADVRETNVGGQLFYRACGFKAVAISRGGFDDTDEDGYLMRFDVEPQAAFEPVNRITEFLEAE